MSRILIIEDEAQLLEDLVTVLTFEGFEVNGAGTCYEGLASARTTPPHLIICDVRLPDCTGFELAQQLHEDDRTKNIPLILMSAHADPYYHKQSTSLRATCFLSKPFEVKQLLKVVKNSLAQD